MADSNIQVVLSAKDNASKVIRQTETSVRNFSAQVNRTQVVNKNFSGGLATVGRSAGQAGLQFSQLVGQIKGGTQPMLALSQQAADLGFVLGVPLVGAIVSIGSALLMGMNKPMEETKKTTSELIDELRKLEVEQGRLTISQQNLLNIRYNERVKELSAELKVLNNQLSANSSQTFAAINKLEKLTEGTTEYDAQLKKINELEKQRTQILVDRTAKEGELNDAVNKTTESSKDFVKNLQKEVDQLGKTRVELLAMQAAKENLSAEDRKLTEQLIGQVQAYEMAQQMTKANKNELDKLKESTLLTSDAMENAAASGLKSMEDGLISLIAGTKSVSDSFKSMATSIISDLIRMQIRSSITAPLANMLGGFFAGAGAVSTVNGVPVENMMTKAYAQTSMSLPVPQATGGAAQAGRPYLVGERGPELFVPGQTGAVVPNGAAAPVNVTLNISTGVAQTVRTEIASLMPQISAATQQAVLDARRRGGSFASAFGG